MPTKAAFKLDDQISVAANGKEITGRLVGIDKYSLESFDGKSCDWVSYTLTSNKKGTFSRYWFVCWGRSEWILWLKARNLTVPQNARMILAKSGIAKIEFAGDAGPSTPFAALSQFQSGEGKYFCAERFTGSKVMFFEGKRIPKPSLR